MKRLSLIAVLVTTVATQAAPFEVTDAWFRKLPGNLPAGGYFIARNNTTHEVAITGARTDACGMVMMHQSQNKGGMSGMDMLDKVTVPAGGKVEFKPNGFHLMCDDPKMKIGGKVAVLLNLSDGTAVAAPFAVRGATGK